MWDVATKFPARIPTATTPLECAELFQTVQACEKITGDMAEVGVFRGGTAAIMLAASLKRLHLFDTFEGLPQSEAQFSKGEWAGSLSEVQRNLREWPGRVEFHAGLFPDSARGLDHLTFSFVHLDMDLYAGTRSALDWFWPRLQRGGDYPLSEGVVRAFDEFFDGRQETFFPLSGNQCMAVKI
jgi:O-methyltransferase